MDNVLNVYVVFVGHVMVNVEHLLTKSEAAKVLERSKRTLQRLCNRGVIHPAITIGGKPHQPGRRILLFRLSDLLDWKHEQEKDEDGHPCAEEQPPK